MILEILLERNAARHDGRELRVVHRTAAGVRGEGFFAAQPIPAAKPVRVAAAMTVFTSLLSDITFCSHLLRIFCGLCGWSFVKSLAVWCLLPGSRPANACSQVVQSTFALQQRCMLSKLPACT